MKDERGAGRITNYEWDITKLKNYKKGRGSVLPFAVSLAELMQVVKKGVL